MLSYLILKTTKWGWWYPHFSENWDSENLCTRSKIHKYKSQASFSCCLISRHNIYWAYGRIQSTLLIKLSNMVALFPFYRQGMFAWKLPGLPHILGNDWQLIFFKGKCFVTMGPQLTGTPLALRIWYFWSIFQWLLSIKCLLCTGGSIQRTGAKGDWSHAFPQSSQPS